MTNRIIQAIIVATILTMVFPQVRRQFNAILADGIRLFQTVQIQLAPASCLGFTLPDDRPSSGLYQRATLAATTFGGAGSYVNRYAHRFPKYSPNTLMPFLGHVDTKFWRHGTKAALGAAHLAMAGQSMPPVCLTTFV